MLDIGGDRPFETETVEVDLHVKVWNESMRDSWDASGSGDGPVIDSGCPFFAHVKNHCFSRVKQTGNEQNCSLAFPLSHVVMSIVSVEVVTRVDVYVYMYIYVNVYICKCIYIYMYLYVLFSFEYVFKSYHTQMWFDPLISFSSWPVASWGLGFDIRTSLLLTTSVCGFRFLWFSASLDALGSCPSLWLSKSS